MSNHAPASEENGVPQESLLEQVLDESNVERAWRRVKANKGAPGIDGMSVADFPAFARSHLPRILDQIWKGSYAPASVRRVWIPKPNGDERPLGIPTVLDRVIQQSMAQALSPIFDADFSDSSFGFRCGRRASDAVAKVSQASQDGYKWGVDCDLRSYFDMVNHDLLMRQISLKVGDKRVLRLIGKYLRAGIKHSDGTRERTLQGVPQGGPLSPLLANIMLDPLDRKVEELGLPFVRYADDFLIMAPTKVEALGAMAEVREFVEGKLKLLVNEEKSRVAPLKECSFLGFHVLGKRIVLTASAERRFKDRIRYITARSRGVSMDQRLSELRQFCTGWFHYFKFGFLYKDARHLDSWIRRRIRLCFWKDWKVPRTRRRMLIKLGIERDRVKLASRSRKGYWRMSSNPLVQIALNDKWLDERGVPSLCKLWAIFKYGDKAQV